VLLLQSQADPSEIMMEVLKALRELDIVWKSIGAYSVRCRWVPPLPNLSKSCNWSAGNSYSESPMTLGSFPLSEMSLQANGVMLDDNELGDQFLVRFEVQVRQSSIFSPCFLFDNLLACFWKCFAGQWNLWVEGNYIAVLISLTLGKWTLQLFRTREGKYLLDLQRVGGPNFLFLELCASFLAEVGAVWPSVSTALMALSRSHKLCFSLCSW
jgi:hypothetical protein